MSLRKASLVLVGLAILLSSFFVIPATTHSQVITLKYSDFTPIIAFPGVQMERWSKEVEKRTNGKVKVNIFPGGTLLTAKNMYEGVVSGVSDVGLFAMSYQPGRFPVSESVDLPLGFTTAKASCLALLDLLEKYRPKELEQVKLVSVFTCPPTDFMTNKPVKTLKDLKGMELRVAGTGVDVVKLLGGVPIAMPQSDTAEAMQKGVIKGMVSSMEILKDFNFGAYCPYATEADLFVVTFAVIMNKERWNSLPSDVKKVIDDLRREQALWTGTYVEDHVKEGVAWCKQKYNLQILELPAADKAEIPKLLKPIVDDYVKKTTAAGLPAEQILKDVYSLRDKYEKEFKK